MDRLCVDRIVVGSERIEALVRVQGELTTAAYSGSAQRTLELLPTLDRHSCNNETGGRFVDELRDTELAHLFEHITVELMALAGSPRSLKGETRWNFAEDGHGVYRVRVAYDLDLVALGALRHAAKVVEWLLGGAGERPDTVAIAEELRALRAV